MANRFDFGNSKEHDEWLALVSEEILEPELPIIDAHHHLWVRQGAPYLLREFVDDLACGHNVVATVFAECHSMYRRAGPERLRAVGESEFVGGIAAMSDSGAFGASQVARAMVGAVDMTLGAAVDEVFDAHLAASGGRFRGVRVSAAWHEDERLASIVDDPGYLERKDVREAIGVLQRRGLSLDCWVYHSQLAQVDDIARAFPDLVIVLNHTGVPILGGPNKGHEAGVFDVWREHMQQIALHPNVYLKVGALPIRASDRDDANLPPSSADVCNAWRPWAEASIEYFGAARCMFESNFPVHKNWCSYAVMWNAFKHLSKDASDADKAALFFGAANRAYRMGLDGQH